MQVTIGSVPLKLCGACTTIVQQDPEDAVATVQRAAGVTLQMKATGPQCEQCDGAAITKVAVEGQMTMLCGQWYV